MTTTETLAEGCQLLQDLLNEDLLEPDAARTNWAAAEPRLALVESTVRGRVLEPLDEALAAAGEERDAWAALVAELLGRAAAAFFAAGQGVGGDRLLSRAAQLAPEETQREDLLAGRRDPAGFTRLKHAQWLRNHGRHRPAGRILRSLEKETLEPVLRDAARRLAKGPRAIKSAPTLFRINGVGMGLYGKRGERADGSYVATYCFSVLWVPLVPVAAYRVSDGGDGTYYFHARESLGRTARIWQGAVAAAFVAGLAFLGVQQYLTSPARLARLGSAEARHLESTGRSAEAMARHLEVANRYPQTPEARASAEAVLRLAAAAVEEPCRAEDVPAVGRVTAAFDRLPAAARTGAPAAYLTGRLLQWSEQIGSETPSAVNAAVAVLEQAGRVAEGAQVSRVSTQRAVLRQKLADALAKADRPVDALLHYVALASPAGLRSARDVLAGLGGDAALWVEAEPEARAWLKQAAKVPKLAADATAFKGRLDASLAAAALNASVIEKEDPGALRAALARAPRDQDLTRAAAAAARGNGDWAGCVARLAALGPPGRLTAEGQQLLGGCLADGGDLAQADAVLSALVEQRLTRYQNARREYAAAGDAIENRLLAQARQGQMPPEVRTAMEKASEEGRNQLFDEWVTRTKASDTRLTALRDEYLRHRAVASASLALGGVKLRRAAEAPPAARRTYLEAAERAYLSIREEAQGTPLYHLGIGQVLYRLGRPEQGEKELQALLQRREPEVTIEVAEIYRELGLLPRAREIAEGLYASSAELQWRQYAALKRAMVGRDLDDVVTWLQRSDQNSFHVKTRLLDTTGDRHLRDGRLAEADRAYAEVARLFDARAAHDGSAANNAAIAFSSRYGATGDVAHLRAAVKRLEAAVRMDPQSAIVAGNLADTLSRLAYVTVLERWVRTRVLILDQSEAAALLSRLQAGPLRPQVLSALHDEPAVRRFLDATRQEQVLAPQKTDPYYRQLGLLRWSRDLAGLRALAATVNAVQGLAGADLAERQAWRSGERDVQARGDADRSVRTSAARLERALKTGHAPTIAAAHMLHADDLDTLAFFTPSPESYAASAEAWRRAVSAWPPAAAERDLSGALLSVAAWRAAPSCPPLKAALDKERRVYALGNLLSRAAAADSAPQVLAALRAQPELSEACRLRGSAAAQDPATMDWVTARLAGDAGLERQAQRVFEREDLALSLGIQARLRADDEDDQADLALFEANRPTRTAAQGR